MPLDTAIRYLAIALLSSSTLSSLLEADKAYLFRATESRAAVRERRASTASDSATNTVRGVVYDSLNSQPAAGATVWVAGGSQSAVADANGRFELLDVPAGKQFIAFTSPGLDSIGLGTLGLDVSVADGTTQVRLGTPSFRTVWRALCRDATGVGSDSGIVWGTVRDAASDTRLNGARAVVSWFDAGVGADKKFGMHENTRDTRSDSTGTYYACGVPSDIAVTLRGAGSRSASGEVQFYVGARRVSRMDVLVSADMVSQTANAPADGIVASKGTSTVRGVVRDEKGVAQGNAMITIASLDSVVRTAADGSFVLRDLPAGTQVVEVRQIGFAQSRQLVHLRPGITQEVAISLNRSTELPAMNVRAARGIAKDREEFEYRRLSGFGYSVTEKELKGRGNMQSALEGFPSIKVSRKNGVLALEGTVSSMRSGPCAEKVTIWIDDFQVSVLDLSELNIQDIRAIEWFPRASTAPAKYVKYCPSVMLVWTVRSRW